jgi:hypothetical protein
VDKAIDVLTQEMAKAGGGAERSALQP